MRRLTQAVGVVFTAGLCRVRPAYRFMLCSVGLLAYLAALLLAMRLLFMAANWQHLRAAGWPAFGRAWLAGLRFDAAVVAYAGGPVLLLLYALAGVRWHAARVLLQAYGAILAVVVPLLAMADLQYFAEAGSRLTYEVVAHLGPSAWPAVAGAFRLHPWLCGGWLAVCAGAGGLTWRGWHRALDWAVPPASPPHPAWLASLPLWVAASVVAGRGGLGRFPLRVSDALVSPSPYANAFGLNPLYAMARSCSGTAQRQFFFFDEAHNARVVRRLLECESEPPLAPRYPLLRWSPGTPEGNRMNVVLFFLESWSGKDIGCLGGDPRATPFFDSLAAEGQLFTRFYACGIRTPEGVFSSLCSFPNQPLRPIVHRPVVFQDTWRSLSQVLADAGYYNLFVHGRDLDFDGFRRLLVSLGFHKTIDRRHFPPSVSTISDSWPGYSDDEVMRRADAEFAALGARPFFGVVYTMNTHPPFVIPEGWPALYPPSAASGRFLNALNYADHTLELFFELARGRAYFRNTLFILVGDHARTGDAFTYGTQHHVPFLVYAPGRVAPACREVVASQLDILPTVLGLLELRGLHASWGRDLARVPDPGGFAVSVVEDQYIWRTSEHLLVDTLAAGRAPLLFDLTHDPGCLQDLWPRAAASGQRLHETLQAYASLSQALLFESRICPVDTSAYAEAVLTQQATSGDGMGRKAWRVVHSTPDAGAPP